MEKMPLFNQLKAEVNTFNVKYWMATLSFSGTNETLTDNENSNGESLPLKEKDKQTISFFPLVWK